MTWSPVLWAWGLTRTSPEPSPTCALNLTPLWFVPKLLQYSKILTSNLSIWICISWEYFPSPELSATSQLSTPPLHISADISDSVRYKYSCSVHSFAPWAGCYLLRGSQYLSDHCVCHLCLHSQLPCCHLSYEVGARKRWGTSWNGSGKSISCIYCNL